MFKNFKVMLTVALIAVAVGVLSLSGLFASPNRSAAQTGENLNQLYQRVSPSVVAISVISTRNGNIVGGGTGSGFVIDTLGHIVTNNHVVDGASEIEIEFYDGTLASAQIVGLDPDSDLAVLQVNVPATQLFPVVFGNSDALVVGEDVLAIGSPFGQNWTLTTGIVSGLDRLIQGLGDFSIGGVIQTDAAINPGNSGGPLLNMSGQVVGVNSQILSESGSNSGVGFSVASNLVQRVAQELIADGDVDYSYIGITGGDVTLRLIQQLGLPANTRGVVINEAVSGSPASQAGLRNATNNSFDIITAVDGLQVKGMDDLISFLARKTIPNQQITLTVLRNGNETVNVPVTLAVRP